MASLILFLFLIIPNFQSVYAQPPSESPVASSAAPSESPTAEAPSDESNNYIPIMCNVTRFPDVCLSTPLGDASTDAEKIVKNAIAASVAKTLKAQELVTNTLTGAANNKNLTVYSSNCLEELNNAMLLLQSSVNGNTNKARVWVSAALVYQSDCLSDFKNVNDTVEIQNLISLLDSLTKMTSNALTMLRAMTIYGIALDSWQPVETERNGFFETNSWEKTLATKFPTDLKIDVTVSKDGKGKFKTIAEAVNAAPVNLTDKKKFVIKINAGTYDEIVTIPVDRKNIVLIGDGIGKTIITGSLIVGPVGVFTYNTATVAVLGEGFMAKDVTFQNTAGSQNKKAVAFRSDSDKSYIENCEFIGHQGTLYVHGLRQLYKSCRIEGNADIIFGNGAGYFKDCEIFINPSLEEPEKGGKNAISAQGRTDPAQSTGFVFNNCSVTGTPAYMKIFQSNPKVHLNYLGRPCEEYARVAFIYSFIDSIIAPAGWMESEDTESSSMSKVYFGEYENKGPGADLKGRVPWSSQIPQSDYDRDILSFVVQSFLYGDDDWFPKS